MIRVMPGKGLRLNILERERLSFLQYIRADSQGGGGCMMWLLS